MDAKLIEWLVGLGLSENLAIFLKTLVFIGAIGGLSILANFILRKIIVSSLGAIIRKTKNTWDDIFLRKKVFHKLSHLAPGLIIYFTAPLMFGSYPGLIPVVEDLSIMYIIIFSVMVANSLILALHEVYNTFPIARDRHIQGYVQVVQILVIFVGLMLIISILFNTNLTRLFTGLGALAAVLMLVFKDTILGFVASIQLSANNMVKPGDWIAMPSRKADGTVLEINLNTVKVQNWDKTISTIPTYALVSESFQNWKGMEESGGRRIKRSINIDVTSIRFCDAQMLDKFKKIHVLKDYIQLRQEEIEAYNAKNKIDPSVLVNGRRMTNVGTFRKYLEEYLRAHPLIHNELTFLVRQLQPTEKGLPIEIYVFSRDQEWANYEAIQADIFDHIMAVIPEFELRIFQNPSGSDFSNLVNK
jgi:miniconductance mechanosensitive channel